MSIKSRAKTGRKLSVLDAMILVAATAGWLTALRIMRIEINLRTYLHPDEYGLLRYVQRPIGLALLFLSVALFLIRLRPPRPSRRRLWRQPGFAAAAAVLLGVAIKALSVIVLNQAVPGRSIRTLDEILRGSSAYCGPAVAGAWFALIVTRRWRAEPGGIDRLGRVLGACWLVEFLVAEMPGRRWIAILGNLISTTVRP